MAFNTNQLQVAMNLLPIYDKLPVQIQNLALDVIADFLKPQSPIRTIEL